MKQRFFTAARMTCRTGLTACAARFQAKMGKGKTSTEASALILAHPGEPISRETEAAGIGDGVCMISPQLNLQSGKTSANMLIRVTFPTTVENACTAVQHLTKSLFLSNRVEPPLSFHGSGTSKSSSKQSSDRHCSGVKSR